MIIDAWVYAEPSAWNAQDLNQPVLTQVITGFWNDFGIYRVYNLLATKEELDQIAADLGTGLYVIYGWVQGSGYDNLGAYETLPADVLAVMKDHEDSSPATYNNPNWGHIFFGQKERIFAGAFSKAFSAAFL